MEKKAPIWIKSDIKNLFGKKKELWEGMFFGRKLSVFQCKMVYFFGNILYFVLCPLLFFFDQILKGAGRKGIFKREKYKSEVGRKTYEYEKVDVEVGAQSFKKRS